MAYVSPEQKLHLASLAARKISIHKKDWILCGGLICRNIYCVPVKGCAVQEFGVCLCGGSDGACLPVPEDIPKVCGYYWLTCYPKFGCCMTLDKLYADKPEELAKFLSVKKDKVIVEACCCGPLCAATGYGPFVPDLCCADEGSTCLCFGSDCAFPFVGSIPMTVAICLPGLVCYPKFGCCMKLGDIIPEDKFEPEPSTIEQGSSMVTGAVVGAIASAPVMGVIVRPVVGAIASAPVIGVVVRS